MRFISERLMKPERSGEFLLSITRSKAKMHEFNVPLEDHIRLPLDPNLLFGLAVGLLGDAAAAIATQTPEDERRLTTAESLRFAATYFDAYINSKLNDVVAPEFGVLASAAYYLSETPGSAKVILKSVALAEVPEQGELYVLVYSLLAARREMNPGLKLYGHYPEALLAELDRFYRLEVPGEAVIGMAGHIRQLAYDEGSDRDVLYADIAMAVVQMKIKNAARSLLPEASGLTLDAWAPAMQKALFPKELWPAQQRICKAGLLLGNSAIIQMPTSAGKTRATELVIRSAFLSQRTDLAVIVAPFRALCHDIRSDLARSFEGEDIILDEATDAYQMDFIFDTLTLPKTVLIITPEKLLYMLRRAPELATQIGLLIYDEGHLFDSAGRGTTYELLLTSLKLTVSTATQVVLISAVIENAEDVAGWLVGNRESVVDGKGMLPMVKSIAFASWLDPRGQLKYVSPTEPDDEEFFVPRVIESVDLPGTPGTPGVRKTKDRPRIKAIPAIPARSFPQKTGAEVGLYLGVKLAGNGHIAVFCGKKRSAATMCQTAVELFRRGLPFPAPGVYSDGAEVAAITALAAHHLGENSSYAKAAQLGIFAHHGSIPHGLKVCIEHAMKDRLINFVVCTSTLAQGVNLPIRYLIVTGVQQGRNEILVRDFHNLIGRAGRAGMHTEGSVIFADPEIIDKRSSRRESWRWSAAKDLLDSGNSEPCASNILVVFLPFIYGEEEKTEVLFSMDELKDLAFREGEIIEAVVDRELSKVADKVKKDFRKHGREVAHIIQSITSYLLTHIDFDTPDWTERLTTLVENTLAYHVSEDGQRAELRILFEELAEELRVHASDPERRALMRRSPLPAEKALRVEAWLVSHQATLEEAAEGGSLFEKVYEFIRAEMMPQRLLALSKDVGLEVGQMWFDERTYVEIFSELTRLDVRTGGNNWHVTIDDTVNICEGVFGYDVAMIVATMTDAAEALGGDLPGAFALLQRQLKYGLDGVAAIAFFEAGFPDRKIAGVFGAVFHAVTTRQEARITLRQRRAEAEELLAPYPTYFKEVLGEIVGA